MGIIIASLVVIEWEGFEFFGYFIIVASLDTVVVATLLLVPPLFIHMRSRLVDQDE